MGVQIVRTDLGFKAWIKKFVLPRIPNFESIKPEK